MNSALHNIYSKEECLKKLTAQNWERTPVSFYRYVRIANVPAFRNELYRTWLALGILGRTYVAPEGINAQISVPQAHWEAFLSTLESRPELAAMPLKVGLEQREAFWKLIVRVKAKIVADGLGEEDYDVTQVGTHLSAEEFHKAMEAGATVVDMRNAYESRIGHFEGALCPDADTFAQELQMIQTLLKGKEAEPVALYCTGGIRCEKASAYLKAQGFKNVGQLHGGIIAYAHQVRQKGLASRFKGANYVFDARVSERVTDDILSTCDQCEAPCDTYTNCTNTMCNLLFLQCPACQAKMQNTCGSACLAILALPPNEQKALRKRQISSTPTLYRRRIRPKLKEGEAKPVFELEKGI